MVNYSFLIILALYCILSFQTAFSQLTLKNKNAGFYNTTELGYGLGIGSFDFRKFQIKANNESVYYRVRTQFGYFISKKLSIGLGVGLDGYHNYTFNMAPLFVDSRYFFKDKPTTFFVAGNAGYGIPISSNFEQGFLCGLFLGRKISTQRITLLPSIGLNLQQVKDYPYPSFSQGGHNIETTPLVSIQFNLGFLI